MNPPDLSRDTSLGPYRILRTLGEGGMGTVYLAHDDSLDRPLAIKVLRTGLEDDLAAALTPRFLREARSAARLNHPHVVTIHTVGKHANQFYIAMEFCPGGSLADELRRNGPLDGDAAADAIRQACLALEAAHSAGIVHRDIKPANLLRSANSSIKLCDFGLARILNSLATTTDPDLTHPGTFVGSPSYASPEQISASPTLDARADLYSLAATWFALLCGQPPFVAEGSADVMRKQLNDPFPDARKTRPDIRPDWMPILWKASAKKPADRYPSAAAMREAIDNVLRKPIPKPVTPSAPVKPLPLESSAEASIITLRSQLNLARSQSDSRSQIAALRGLFGLYSQTDRRDEALQAFREAIALHVRTEASARFPHTRN